jgi:hypothetical protein
LRGKREIDFSWRLKKEITQKVVSLHPNINKDMGTRGCSGIVK